jgi:hypothetical protein
MKVIEVWTEDLMNEGRIQVDMGAGIRWSDNQTAVKLEIELDGEEKENGKSEREVTVIGSRH